MIPSAPEQTQMNKAQDGDFAVLLLYLISYAPIPVRSGTVFQKV